MTKPYHIIADGFAKIQINHFWKQQPTLTGNQKSFLEEYIIKQQKSAEATGGSFTDGDMIGVRLDSIRTSDNTLIMDLQAMSYAKHAGLFREDPESNIQAMYVNALVITSDNYLVFGSNQFTEANWMGKLGIPAGVLEKGPDGLPNFGAQLYRELSEEIGFAADYHKKGEILPGWINGASEREKNYHLTTSFVVPLSLNAEEVKEYFNEWKHVQENIISKLNLRGAKLKTEFGQLLTVPNNPMYLYNFIKEQDEMGKNANLLGKSLDVVQEWANQYSCDPVELKAFHAGSANIYLPQSRI